ncbi:MAG TPA: 1,2-phenylacetyl-CoA epoxidase subunit PaaD [Dermatophilaceae bacterium]|nr:1,2-phenylacetyl-CoA epoxidase subunit PaaD [Dermatophilaceae bacterium]
MVTFEVVAERVRSVPDPEIPVISIEDLGILRSVTEVGGTVHVLVTPTYSGCPAMEAIRASIERVAADAGWPVQVQTCLTPAWTTDWISQRGLTALADFGIAPPARSAVPLRLRRVRCPQCGSADTEELSRFGSTACKALRRCRSCGEPFEQFKAL